MHLLSRYMCIDLRRGRCLWGDWRPRWQRRTLQTISRSSGSSRWVVVVVVEVEVVIVSYIVCVLYTKYVTVVIPINTLTHRVCCIYHTYVYTILVHATANIYPYIQTIYMYTIYTGCSSNGRPRHQPQPRVRLHHLRGGGKRGGGPKDEKWDSGQVGRSQAGWTARRTSWWRVRIVCIHDVLYVYL